MASLYYYTARDVRGVFVRGSIEAGSASAALASLRMRALFVTSLESAASTRGAFAAMLQVGGVSQRSLAAFFRSFSTLVHAGVPIRRSLDVAVAQTGDSRLREALHALICDIENGLSLSDAMARRPREFPRLYVAMVKAGELGGVLDEVLERVANVMEGERAARKRLWAALTYPLVVSGAAAGLILFLLTTIVPMFRAMYAQLHVPLPAVTSALIAAGVALQSPLTWTCLAAAAATAVFAVLRIRAAQRGAMLLESLVLALPVAGPIMKKTSIGRFARMLGTLLRSGVALVWALDIVTDVVTGPRLRQSIADLRQALREGALVSSSLERSGLYEPMFIQLVHVGEETGSLDAMLLRIAEYYELDVETMLAALGSMLEPLMILVLGGAVGFIVAAVFIPLYTLIGNIK